MGSSRVTQVLSNGQKEKQKGQGLQVCWLGPRCVVLHRETNKFVSVEGLPVTSPARSLVNHEHAPI